MSESLQGRVVSGAFWVTAERLAMQAVGFFVSMVLARLLTPNDYGTVALLSIFFSVAGSLARCGFGNALVQKQDVGDLEFNSVFYLSLLASSLIYVFFFFAAPYIADFYHVPVLCPITRVSALQFVFSAINSVQVAELNRKMQFNLQFRISLIVGLVSAIAGISLACFGLGVWALVLSSLLSGLASVIAWWTVIAWRPKLMFSLRSVKGLFSYGWKMTVAGLLHSASSELYGFLIGRLYTPADLAFVNKGNSVPNLLMSTIDGTILGVSFPALAKMQNDPSRVRNAMRRMIRASTFMVFPVLAGLAACSKIVILLLYGDQWLPAVPYVCIACFSLSLYPFNSINTSAISAMGRSDIYLILDVVKKAFMILVVVVSVRYGVLFLMCALAFVESPFAVLVNTFANGRLLKYNIFMQIRDVLPAGIVSGVMFGTVRAIIYFAEKLFAGVPSVVGAVGILILCLVIGAVVYIGLAVAFKMTALKEYLAAAYPVLCRRIPWLAMKLRSVVAYVG